MLAVDLLNPSPQAEARKHKLKVCHIAIFYSHMFKMVSKLSGIICTVTPTHIYIDTGARPTVLLHGRQVPRLLHHHHRLLARPDRRHLRRVLDGAVPAYGWKSTTDGGLFVPEKVKMISSARKKDVRVEEVRWRSR